MERCQTGQGSGLGVWVLGSAGWCMWSCGWQTESSFTIPVATSHSPERACARFLTRTCDGQPVLLHDLGSVSVLVLRAIILE